jgi:manganese/zinc/iron transport system substrate-binding protein
MKHFMLAGVFLLGISGFLWGQMDVVCTTGMVGDLVRQVGGDRVKVTTLMIEGVDPHLFKPTRDDVARILKADLVFYSGLHLEGRMEETFEKLSSKGKSITPVTSEIPEALLLKEGAVVDPHVWMNPALWASCTKTVSDSLAKKDPEGAAIYAANATRYATQLQSLETTLRSLIATIPDDQRVLITAHDAFQYFAKATGLTVMSIQGLSSSSEAGVADINRLVDAIVTHRIPAVFIESTLSEKNIRAVMEGTASRGFEVKLGGMLFADSMGKAGTPEGTYIGMIEHNVTTITQSLGGRIPTKEEAHP